MKRAGRIADAEEVRDHLLVAASSGHALTYADLLAMLGHQFSRPKMRALCKTLAAVDAEAEARGEPELAVLVVRQSDGLPGQGWWVGGGGSLHGYEGLWDGSEATEFIAQLQQKRRSIIGQWRKREVRAKGHAMASPPDNFRTFTVAEDDDGIRLDRWFKRHLPDISFNLVSRWARTGLLKVDGQRVAPGDRVATRQVLRVPPAEAAPAEGPEGRTLRSAEPLTEDETHFVQDMVVARGKDWIMLNKPPGLATQGGTKTVQHLDRLLDGLADEQGQRPKLVHRLDKDTSGVLLVARTARAAGHFAKAFSGRTARKVYWALVVGWPSTPEGVIDAPLAKQPGSGGEKMHVDEKDGLPARTRYRQIDRAGNRATWVELQPMTGRTHQLRAHMAAIGHPIVGDAKYGGAAAFLTGGISRKMHLHARRLRIDGTDGKAIDHLAELPPHFAETLATLGFEQLAGDMLPLDNPDPAKSLETKVKRVAAAAKTARKARKGERRSRGAPTDLPTPKRRPLKPGEKPRGSAPGKALASKRSPPRKK